MMIMSVKVSKISQFDNRYPDPDAFGGRKFSGVYLLACETDQGPMECPFFCAADRPMTSPQIMSDMLHFFAVTLERLEDKKAA